MPLLSMPKAGTWEVRAGWVVSALCVDLKLRDFQAAGLVGGFGVESGEFRKLHEIGQPEGQGGYGWAQWTGARRRAFLAFASREGLDWTSSEANYRFLLYELRHGYKGFLAKLKKTGSLEEATHLAHREYETPQEVLDGTETSYSQRLTYAQRALAGSKQEAPSDEPASAPSPDLDDALLAQASLTRIIQRGLALKVDGDYGVETRSAVQTYLKARKS